MSHSFSLQTHPVCLKLNHKHVIYCVIHSYVCHAVEQSRGSCKLPWLLLLVSLCFLTRSTMTSRLSCETRTAGWCSRQALSVYSTGIFVSPNVQCMCCGFCPWAFARPSSCQIWHPSSWPLSSGKCICAIMAAFHMSPDAGQGCAGTCCIQPLDAQFASGLYGLPLHV